MSTSEGRADVDQRALVVPSVQPLQVLGLEDHRGVATGAGEVEVLGLGTSWALTGRRESDSVGRHAAWRASIRL